MDLKFGDYASYLSKFIMSDFNENSSTGFKIAIILVNLDQYLTNPLKNASRQSVLKLIFCKIEQADLFQNSLQFRQII